MLCCLLQRLNNEKRTHLSPPTSHELKAIGCNVAGILLPLSFQSGSHLLCATLTPLDAASIHRWTRQHRAYNPHVSTLVLTSKGHVSVYSANNGQSVLLQPVDAQKNLHGCIQSARPESLWSLGNANLPQSSPPQLIFHTAGFASPST